MRSVEVCIHRISDSGTLCDIRPTHAASSICSSLATVAKLLSNDPMSREDFLQLFVRHDLPFHTGLLDADDFERVLSSNQGMSLDEFDARELATQCVPA